MIRPVSAKTGKPLKTKRGVPLKPRPGFNTGTDIDFDLSELDPDLRRLFEG